MARGTGIVCFKKLTSNNIEGGRKLSSTRKEENLKVNEGQVKKGIFRLGWGGIKFANENQDRQGYAETTTTCGKRGYILTV